MWEHTDDHYGQAWMRFPKGVGADASKGPKHEVWSTSELRDQGNEENPTKSERSSQ